MRPITETLYRNLALYQKRCDHFKDNVCAKGSGCICIRWAEVWAYIQSVIPDEYQHYTIQNFTGMKDANILLPPTLVAAAKDVLIKYCWKDVEPGDDYDKTWITKCILQNRRDNGSSIIIYGDPWKHDVSKASVKTFRRPLGRTMLAAIVMKEAIFQRLLGGHGSDSYAWVPYQTLCHRLMSKANGDNSHNADLLYYEECDWLVVDGLQASSDASRAFRASVLEKMFGERVEAGLPSILVFQDDISKTDEQDFGPTINSIINSRKTFRVALLDGDVSRKKLGI